MCGFVGFANLGKDISKDLHILKNMNLKLQKRGPDEEGYFIDTNVALAHRRLVIIDRENGKQPMSIKHNNITYTIIYNGQIYNKDEIKKELISLGCEFKRIFRYRGIIKSIYSFWKKCFKKTKWNF